MANECRRVVTLGYIKEFIGDLVQDESGNTVHVNNQGKPDSYCPTYEELTGGTYIRVRNPKTQPSEDIDGISIGGSYSPKQLVVREDLSVGYTRFKSIIGSATSYEISECGGSSTLSYTLVYTRTIQSTDSTCTSTTSTTSDNEDTSATWSTSSFGTIIDSEFSVEKNGSVSSDARTTAIKISKTFRGTEQSDSFDITQKALTGSYSTFVSSSITSYDSFSISPKSFNCNGGTITSAGTYTITSIYKWVDSCNVDYPSVTSSTTTSMSESGSRTVGSRSHYDSTCTPAEGTTTIVTWNGLSDTYTQTCECINCDCAVEITEIS